MANLSLSLSIGNNICFDTRSSSSPYTCKWNYRLMVNSCRVCKSDENGRIGEKTKIGVELDLYTCGRLLQRCAVMKSTEGGKAVHAHLIKTSLQNDTFMDNTLIHMYSKCGFLEDALQVFDRTINKNIVSWTTMIAGYAQNFQGQKALELYGTMLTNTNSKQLKPNQSTFASVLRACANLACLEYGKQAHAHVVKYGFAFDVRIGNALVTMYSKCVSIKDARKVFEKMSERDVVSWSAMISGCVHNGDAGHAQQLFSHMSWLGLKSDHYTFSTVLVSCGLDLGKQIHCHVIKNLFQSDRDSVLESSLLTMYAKSNEMNDARKVFDNMVESHRDPITWTAMIGGYAHCGRGEEALKLFMMMVAFGGYPDDFSFTTVLGVCAELACLNHGKQLHAQIIKRGFELATSVSSALVTMYSKCSCISEAQRVFKTMPKHDMISWTAMIAGYALHGLAKEAILLFEQMQCAGIKPDHITFVGVLSACSHGGLVDEGRKYFDCMSSKYGIMPSMEHYACMVDLFGRAGLLNEAEGIINEMPFEPSAFVLGTFLSACRIHGNIKLGEQVAERLIALEPRESAPYVLLSNIYAMESRWDDVLKVRNLMKERRIQKEPGQSWIMIKDKVHAFYVEDKAHPQTEEIYAKLKEMYSQIAAAGYVPDTKFVLQHMEQEQKEVSLSHHSEKLAIVYGLISTAPGIPIQVFKNLRVCGDCHSATKFISSVAKREIILRDASRFHHFMDGICSCGDYW